MQTSNFQFAISHPTNSRTNLQTVLAYLRKAISQLSAKQREVFILRHWDGLSLKEIAHTVGRSVGTVKAHLFYAHRNLQNSLRPYLQVEQRGDSNS